MVTLISKLQQSQASCTEQQHQVKAL